MQSLLLALILSGQVRYGSDGHSAKLASGVVIRLDSVSSGSTGYSFDGATWEQGSVHGYTIVGGKRRPLPKPNPAEVTITFSVLNAKSKDQVDYTARIREDPMSSFGWDWDQTQKEGHGSASATLPGRRYCNLEIDTCEGPYHPYATYVRHGTSMRLQSGPDLKSKVGWTDEGRRRLIWCTLADAFAKPKRWYVLDFSIPSDAALRQQFRVTAIDAEGKSLASSSDMFHGPDYNIGLGGTGRATDIRRLDRVVVEARQKTILTFRNISLRPGSAKR
jgi:hypothetical protein